MHLIGQSTDREGGVELRLGPEDQEQNRGLGVRGLLIYLGFRNILATF